MSLGAQLVFSCAGSASSEITVGNYMPADEPAGSPVVKATIEQSRRTSSDPTYTARRLTCEKCDAAWSHAPSCLQALIAGITLQESAGHQQSAYVRGICPRKESGRIS